MTDLVVAENDVERALMSPARVSVARDVRARHRAALLEAIAAEPTSLAPQRDYDAAPAQPAEVVDLSDARRRRRRRVTVVVVGAVLVTAVGGGLAVAVSKLRPSDPMMVRCFAVATTDLDNPAYGFDLGVAAPPGGTVPSVAAQALDQCGQAWSRGELSVTAPHVPADFPGSGQPVPHLVACVLPEGYVGVFPGPAGTCDALGLPEADL